MFTLSCVLQSHSHNLNRKAFKHLMNDASQAQVTYITQRQIEVTFKSPKRLFSNLDEFYPKAHLMASNFVMAINIASLGHFTWLDGNHLFPTYHHPQSKTKETRKNIIYTTQRNYPSDILKITEKQVKNTAHIYGALLYEEDQYIRKEYVKGIIHFGLSFQDINFDKDAFANFYRLLEYFVTKRILKQSKLKNELKEFEKALSNLGLAKEFTDEFANLYKLRSEQVMHAQKDQINIDMDDVIKIKVLLDYTLHKHYIKIADQGLEEIRSASNNGVE